jgi:hypothetical protein
MVAGSPVKQERLHKLQVADSPIHGKGVFAGIRFRQGDHILQYDDTRVVSPEHPLLPEDDEKVEHLNWLANGKVVVAQYPERYLNHSCDPNSYVQSKGHWRYLIALRAIQSGEEITIDYSINGCGDDTWQCHCGSPRCRHTVFGDFFRLPRELQVEYLPYLEEWFVAEHSQQVRALRSLS